MISQRTLILLVAFVVNTKTEDVDDFKFSDRDEIMIAQESRQYQTIVKPPIKIYKPTGITNSHRPQYNIDSEEDDRLNRADFDYEVTTRKAKKELYPYKLRSKEMFIRDAVLRALERKDHVGKFAQVLPIVRGMSGSQRVALASLVAKQVATPPGRSPLNLAQVRSMFGNHENTTTDLMLPILLDMANLFRKANKHGKQTREVHEPITRSSDTTNQEPDTQQRKHRENKQNISRRSDTELDETPFETFETTTAKQKTTTKTQERNRRFRRPMKKQEQTIQDKNTTLNNNITVTDNVIDTEDANEVNATKKLLHPSAFATDASGLSNVTDTSDLTADATNQTLAQDLPVAEKLRALNRYVDRKGNFIRRIPPKPQPPPSLQSTLRRTTSEATITAVRRRPSPLGTLRKPPQTEGKCELFTTSLCLHSEDYPTDAIVQSIRRNKAAAGALLADYRDPGEGALDGVSAAQEAKYTPEHYLTSNRRGDTATRDFASAGEAGFMCPSIVKYARPQRARATSGLWKYIVNTGEHTQTLRLEKCLKPKESCTYLTDNFKSKCVQVYNYHRLLTWDQQNGLHMDIFKVPTCCSCHIEGYSVNFPPLGNRIHETSSENFPEDLPASHGNNAFESVQSSIQRPSVTKNPPPFLMKPLESFPAHSENHNLISNPSFTGSKLLETDQFDTSVPTGPIDSYGNSYFPDSFNQASSIRNVKRPPASRIPSSAASLDTVTLPSYLEPPTPAGPSSFSFVKETPSKYKITSSSQYKRGAPRPSRRPIRKKISGAPDDLMSSGTSAVDSFTGGDLETLQDFNDDIEEPDVVTQNKGTIAPKLPAVSTEESPSSPAPKENVTKKANKETVGANGKKVNYNYHPIIDFFEEGAKEDESIDREDSAPSYEVSLDSEWKPINHPVNTGSNSLGRKKH